MWQFVWILIADGKKGKKYKRCDGRVYAVKIGWE